MRRRPFNVGKQHRGTPRPLQRVERYRDGGGAYLENAVKEEAKDAVIVIPAQLEKAKTAATQVPMKPPKYFKVVCEHCGHIMFIKEGDAVFVSE